MWLIVRSGHIRPSARHKGQHISHHIELPHFASHWLCKVKTNGALCDVNEISITVGPLRLGCCPVAKGNVGRQQSKH